MNKLENLSERNHGMDALRASMMLLGIILHAALSFTQMPTDDFLWIYKDTATNQVFDAFVVIVHAFRMPVFFVTAGFFGALLYAKYGLNGFLINRLKRIFIPFAISILVLGPITISAFHYCMTKGTATASFINSFSSEVFSGYFDHWYLMHFWFLYYLLLFYVLMTVILQWKIQLPATLRNFVSNPIAPFFLGLITCFLVFGMKTGTFDTPLYLTTFDPLIFVNYFILFSFGWILFTTPEVIASQKKHYKIHFMVSTALAIPFLLILQINNGYDHPGNHFLAALLTAQMAWCSIYFCIGYFPLTYIHENRLIRRISKASYLAYLIHIPIIVMVTSMVKELSVNAILKFILVLTLSLIVLFLIEQLKQFILNSLRNSRT